MEISRLRAELEDFKREKGDLAVHAVELEERLGD